MIHLHPVRKRQVKASINNMIGTLFGDAPRNIESPDLTTIITNGISCHADTNLRHHVQKEAVVVVRCEQENQFRIKISNFITHDLDDLFCLLNNLRHGVVAPLKR